MISQLRTIVLATAMFLCGAGAATAQTATIQVIHNSPSPAAASVDIYLNGAGPAAVGGLGFRQATGLVDLPAGSYTVGIAPGGSSGPGDVIASFGPYDLAAGSQTVIMAAGELGSDFGLFVAGLQTAAPGGQVSVLAFHGAPDAPTVDVAALGVGNIFPGLAYLAFQGYLTVPAADYVLTVAPAGGSPIAAFDAPLSGLGGGTAVVFASGYLGASPAFGLFAALNDGTVLALPANDTVDAEDASWSGFKAAYR
ncbi:MAG: DUF4397 domain-containing protein [Krumholzibacteria bacterium]|nr:DUF4397 domain-containing protein [Candidatus Krumholzibacteria bacterium]